MNKKKDRWDICRTCGDAGDIEIFGRDGVSLQLEEKINSYLPITVSKKLVIICIFIHNDPKITIHFKITKFEN